MKTFISVKCTPHRTVNIEVKQESALELLHAFVETGCPFPVSVTMEEGEPESETTTFIEVALILLVVV